MIFFLGTYYSSNSLVTSISLTIDFRIHSSVVECKPSNAKRLFSERSVPIAIASLNYLLEI